VLGRVSMDLVALDCDAAPELKEGEWVELDYDLPDRERGSPACRNMSC
jgi:alanine racemase